MFDHVLIGACLTGIDIEITRHRLVECIAIAYPKWLPAAFVKLPFELWEYGFSPSGRFVQVEDDASNCCHSIIGHSARIALCRRVLYAMSLDENRPSVCWSPPFSWKKMATRSKHKCPLPQKKTTRAATWQRRTNFSYSTDVCYQHLCIDWS